MIRYDDSNKAMTSKFHKFFFRKRSFFQKWDGLYPCIEPSKFQSLDEAESTINTVSQLRTSPKNLGFNIFLT